MESFQSKLAKLLIKVYGRNKIWKQSGMDLRDLVEKRQRKMKAEPPGGFKRNVNIIKKEMRGHVYYVISPIKKKTNKTILYLHGGSYVYTITSFHWNFLSKLIDALQCTIVVPIYPLAPAYQHTDVFAMILPIYREIISMVNSKDVIIMGDSAGGGLSLALAQLLREKRLKQPEHIILISPALDMTLTNPEIDNIQLVDSFLAKPGIIDAGKWYAGDKYPAHYLISPIYGDFHNLGKISIFIGTHDILYPDSRRFNELMEERKIAINYFEYPLMIHVWPLLFFPESRQALNEIVQIIDS
ncbi:MAG: alpha/beta hydrolase fold domain-containing protein [Bacillaceae bacterium]